LGTQGEPKIAYVINFTTKFRALRGWHKKCSYKEEGYEEAELEVSSIA